MEETLKHSLPVFSLLWIWAPFLRGKNKHVLYKCTSSYSCKCGRDKGHKVWMHTSTLCNKTPLIFIAPSLKESVMYQGHLTHPSLKHSSALSAFLSFTAVWSTALGGLGHFYIKGELASPPSSPGGVSAWKQGHRTCTLGPTNSVLICLEIFLIMLICASTALPLFVHPIFNIWYAEGGLCKRQLGLTSLPTHSLIIITDWTNF